MTPEERIEYLVSEVNRLNNFIAERDQKIEMLYEEKASLMDEVKNLRRKLDLRDELTLVLRERIRNANAFVQRERELNAKWTQEILDEEE